MDTVRLFPVLILVMAGLLGMTLARDVSNGPQPQRDQAVRLMRAGNYKDAYDVFRKLALDPQDDPRKVGEDLQMATQCLANLNRISEIDAFCEAVVAIHKANWRLLWAAAENYMQVQHRGFALLGNSNADPTAEEERLSTRSIGIEFGHCNSCNRRLPLASKEADHPAVGRFFLNLAGMLLNQRGASESWRLQYLTDLGTLPDYESGWWYYRGEVRGAPVDEAGRPIYYQVPKSWAAAQSDGQRWRWCLAQAAEFDPGRLQEIRLVFANFLHDQFGVQTMAFFGWQFGRMDTDDTQEAERHLRLEYASRRRRPSPGWPRASGDSTCPRSSTTSASTSRWPGKPRTIAGSRPCPDLARSSRIGGNIPARPSTGSRRPRRQPATGAAGISRSAGANRGRLGPVRAHD